MEKPPAQKPDLFSRVSGAVQRSVSEAAGAVERSVADVFQWVPTSTTKRSDAERAAHLKAKATPIDASPAASSPRQTSRDTDRSTDNSLYELSCMSTANSLIELSRPTPAEVAFWGKDTTTMASGDVQVGRMSMRELSSVAEDIAEESGGAAVVTKQILIIYTGGTIGMVTTPHGYDVEPNYLANQLRANPRFNSGDTPGKLVLPQSPRGYRVEYSIYEYSTLLDSANMAVTDWMRIAADVEEAYDLYDGFIVLHGTDTMAYTASVRVQPRVQRLILAPPRKRRGVDLSLRITRDGTPPSRH